MKVDYISDLHVNHQIDKPDNFLEWEKRTKEWVEGMLKESKGDILVIAGDFGIYTEQNLWVLEEAAQHYEQVFFVTGNHDRYLATMEQQLKYRTSTSKITDFLEQSAGIARVTPLERTVTDYKGIKIAGDGLWYKFSTEEEIQRYLANTNDATYIIEETKQRKVPELLYARSMDWYNQLRGMDIDLMVSHIPPVHPPISTFKPDARFNCPTEFLVGKHWVAGHTHIRGHFKQEKTQFHFHTLGYPYESQNDSTHPYKPRSFDIVK